MPLAWEVSHLLGSFGISLVAAHGAPEALWSFATATLQNNGPESFELDKQTQGRNTATPGPRPLLDPWAVSEGAKRR